MLCDRFRNMLEYRKRLKGLQVKLMSEENRMDRLSQQSMRFRFLVERTR